MISEYKKEKDRIEKLADQWCRDNNYPIRKSNYKKSQNMSRPYKGTSEQAIRGFSIHTS
jgi:hypothetical protein